MGKREFCGGDGPQCVDVSGQSDKGATEMRPLDLATKTVRNYQRAQ